MVFRWLCRFNFDWEVSEDTHEARLHEGPVLFGRGTLAGIDRKAQRECAAKREQQLLSDMRRARGDRTTAADIQADMARASRASHIDDDPVRSLFCCPFRLSYFPTRALCLVCGVRVKSAAVIWTCANDSKPFVTTVNMASETLTLAR